MASVCRDCCDEAIRSRTRHGRRPRSGMVRMHAYSPPHEATSVRPIPLRQLEDHEILAGTLQSYRSIRRQAAGFLRLLAELDRRQLFRAAGFPSAHQFCIERMGMSEDQAFKNLRAARAGRRFPIVFDMIADGRTNVSAITILSKHLTRTLGESLLRDSAGMTNAQVRSLLAARFPQPDVPTVMFALMTPAAETKLSAGVSEMTCKLAVRPVEASNPLQGIERLEGLSIEVASISPVPALAYTRIAPLSPASYALQCTLSAAAHAKLREVQNLLGPRVSPSDMSQVLELALDALLQQLERSRKAAIRRPEPESHADAESSGAAPTGPRLDTVPANARHIPASVRRAVWARDGGGCQFVSATGHRCLSRSGVELDHVRPVALGGASTLGNLRLLCRAHNQLEAERRLGSEFIRAERAAPR